MAGEHTKKKGTTIQPGTPIHRSREPGAAPRVVVALDDVVCVSCAQ